MAFGARQSCRTAAVQLNGVVEPANAVLASRTRVVEGAPDLGARSLAAATRALLGV